MDGVFYHLELLKMNIEASQHPDGAKMRPAKTCKDLNNCYHGVKTGEFWIDPNGGCNMDSFQAHCNYTDKINPETCIRPSNTKFASKTLKDVVASTAVKDSEYVWFLADLDTEAKFEYVADPVQIRYMRLNSMKARQNVTFHCKNIHAHKNSYGSSKKFVKVLTADDFELNTRKHHPKNRLDILEDGCAKRDGQWHKTVFQYESSSIDRLPIQDVAVWFDDEQMERKDLEFAIELGPVCFS